MPSAAEGSDIVDATNSAEFSFKSVEGNSNHQKLAAARGHLAAVVQELSLLQEAVTSEAAEPEEVASSGQPPGGEPIVADGESKEAVEDASPKTTEVEYTAPNQMDLVDVVDRRLFEQTQLELKRTQNQFRHLELDHEATAARLQRVLEDNKVLVQTQATLEGKLRESHKKLNETRRLLRHSELRVKRLGGEVVEKEIGSPEVCTPTDCAETSPGGNPSTPSPAHSQGDALLQNSLNTRAQLGPVGIKNGTAAHSKQQLLAALSAAQAELQEERRVREHLERRVYKDHERLERLAGLAETHRNDLLVAKHRNMTLEKYASDCDRHFKKFMLRSNSLHTTIDIAKQSHSSFNGSGSGNMGKSFGRQSSAPHLPTVSPGRGS